MSQTNLGELYIRIGAMADFTSVNAEYAKLEKSTKAAQEINKQYTRSLDNVYKSAMHSASAFLPLIEEIEKTEKAFRDAKTGQEAFEESLQKAKINQAIETNKQLAKELDNVSKSAKDSAQVWVDLDNAQAEAVAIDKLRNVSAKQVADSMRQQAKAAFNAELEVARMSKRYESLKGGKVHIANINAAFKEYDTTLKSGVLSQDKFTAAQQKFRKAMEKSKNETYEARKPLNGMQETLNELSRTAVVALGPLSGVASRLTAISAVVNRQTIGFAVMVGLVAGFSVLMQKAVVAGAQMEAQLLKMDNALRFTGNSAGLTAIQLNDMARALAINTLTSTAFARESAIALTAFRGVAKEAFPEILSLAQDLSATMGGSLLENTKRLGQVMEDPIRALGNLGESGVRFTKTQQEVIESFVRTGQAAKASAYIMDEIRSRVGGAGEAEAKGLAGAWDTLVERLTGFVEKVGMVSESGGALTETINNISNAVKYYTENTDVAKEIGERFASILSIIASVVGFVARNLDIAVVALKLFVEGYLIHKGLQFVELLFKITGGFNATTVATNLATIAQLKYKAAVEAVTLRLATLNTLLRANPYIAALVGIIAIGGGLMLWARSARMAESSQKGLNDSVKEAIVDYDNLIKKQKEASAGRAFEANKKSLEQLGIALKGIQGKLSITPDDATLKKAEAAIISKMDVIQARQDKLSQHAQGLDFIPQSSRDFEASMKLNEDMVKKLVPSADAASEWKKINEQVAWYVAEASKGTDYLAAHFKALDKEATTDQIAKQVKDFQQLASAMKYAAKETGPFKNVQDTFEKLSKDIVNSTKYSTEFGKNGKEAADKVKRSLDLISYGDDIKDKLLNKTQDALKAVVEKMKSVGINIGDIFTGKLDQGGMINAIVKGLVDAKESADDLARALTIKDTFKDLSKGIVRTSLELDMLASHGEFATKKLKDAFEIQDLAASINSSIETFAELEVATKEAAKAGIDISSVNLNQANTANGLAQQISNLIVVLVNAKRAGQELADAQRHVWDSSGIVEMNNKLNDTNLTLDVMDKMSISDKFINMFDTAPLDAAIEKEKGVRALTVSLQQLSDVSPSSFGAQIDVVQAALERLNITGQDLSSPSGMAAAMAAIGEKMKNLPMSAKAVADAVANIAGQAASLFGQLSNMYAEQAAYHKQMAEDALSYGRDQANLYMDLADAVRYSNNVQAKSFEDKAIAAANAAAVQYNAEKKAQAQSNAMAKQQFENQKKLQIAQAVASTAAAVVGTLGNQAPLLGPFAVPIAMAMGALGAAQVGIIQQQQYTPRVNGGSIYGNKAYVTSETGPEIFMPGRSGTMISQKEIMDGLSGGGGGTTNVNFTIQALDTQSGLEVIMANRGAIVSMINQENNKRTRR